MRLDAVLEFDVELEQVTSLAQRAERIGFSALWTTEVRRDPFLPLAVAASQSTSIGLGTSVAVAFARSPTALAHTAWDLAGASKGRFILGLGTQVQAHIERRFGMSWSGRPVDQLRDYVAALRAVWRAWQVGERPSQRNTHYPVTLMTPFFSPRAMEHADIPVYIAAVGPAMCRLAGEVADGLIVHPMHSPLYLAEVIRPALEAGARRTGRSPAEIEMTAMVFVATSETEREDVRRNIAFYASTPSYRRVLRIHGWESVGRELSEHARHGRWAEMSRLVPAEMLEAFSITTEWSGMAARLHERYAGLLDRITLYRPYGQTGDEAGWQRLLADLTTSS